MSELEVDFLKPIHLVRIHDRVGFLEQHGRVCLGWSDIAHVDLDYEQYSRRFRSLGYQYVKYDLWNFVNGITPGELAVVDPGDGTYSVVQLLEYEYREDWLEADAAHARRCEVLQVNGKGAKGVHPRYFSPLLRHRLGQGSRGLTCYPLQPQSSPSPDEYARQLKESLFLRWMDGVSYRVKDEIEARLVEQLWGDLQWELHHPGQLEDLLVRLLKLSGADQAIRLGTQQASDGDVDVEGLFRIGWEHPEQSLIRIGIQAKWRKGDSASADREGFEQLSRRLADPGREIERGYLVTTARSFEPDLVAHVQNYNRELEDRGQQLRLELIDGYRLARWILNVGLEALDAISEP